MSPERSFARKYSLNIARLSPGQHEEQFDIDDDFFQHFDRSLIEAGQVKVKVKIMKYETHLDVRFYFDGELMLPCDRCMELYPQPISTEHRIFYSFDPDMDFEGYEVMHIDRDKPDLNVVQELYDFIHLAMPIRRVPPKEVHLCPENVLALLGLDAEGNPAEPEEEEGEAPIDPRWEALRKLKEENNN
jgi:uncharacterized protein